MITILSSLIFVCALWAVTASILIVRNLQKRGTRVTTIWLRLRLFQYISKYREITIEESGRIGPLFYHYIISLSTAVLFVFILIVYELI